MFLSEPEPTWHKSVCHKSLPFFCGFQFTTLTFRSVLKNVSVGVGAGGRHTSQRSSAAGIGRAAVSAWEAGKPPVYHNCLTVEQSEKSAERRDTDSEIWLIGVREGSDSDGQGRKGGSPRSPYRLHDEAHNDGQTHTAAHHSDYNSCDFTCTEEHSEGWHGEEKLPGFTAEDFCHVLQHQLDSLFVLL